MAEAATLRPEQYVRRREQLAGWEVNVVSYKLGDKFLCEVDNVSPGAIIARGQGATREEAESQALAQARERLARTRRFPT
ncbi:MAG: hypothetical protein KatS3mg131_1712 [Candidatus Tectimicrobiota bacterium]|nr:MAG: hypothetical protein KatS3mg131_1712 [Candidatus Tectomicrobia bacterium]